MKSTPVRPAALMRAWVSTILLALVAITALPAAGGGEAGAIAPEPTTAADRIISLDDQLPLNPAIRHGRLANGLEWYVLEHPFPEDVVVLRLVVDAGSVQEREAQRGLAHFVEHMAFNGTEQFGETELVAYLEGLGIQFGPDVNAYTSFDETVYKLEVPSGDRDALETGFRVMQQWAHALTFDAEAIERERGVIVEEWRSRRGAAQRLLETHIPVLFSGSRYAERLPIGELDVIRGAPREEFVAYFDRWYRPDNMAFIAVGDMPAAELEALVETHLGPLARPASPLDRPYFEVPLTDGVRASVAADAEATRSTVSLYALRPPYPSQTVSDYRAMLVRALFASVINERIREIARDPDSPINSGGIGWNRFLRGTEISIASAVARDDRALEALETLLAEVERARRYGVTEGELTRARNRLLQSIEESFVNIDTRPASSLADELVRHWTEGETVPGIEIEYRLFNQLLPTIGRGEVGAIAAEFSMDSAVLLASLRQGDAGRYPDGRPLPSAADLQAVPARVAQLTLEPPHQQAVRTTLMERRPEPGTVEQRVAHDSVDTTEYRLSNGVRLFVKPTDFAEDEVLVSAWSPGGLSLLSDEDAVAGRIAASVARESGIGDLTASELERVLAGSSVDLTTSLGATAESLGASARGDDLELLFQLIHLAFTAPRFEERALRSVVQQTIQQIEGAEASPQGRFGRELLALYSAGDPRSAPLEAADLEALQLEAVRRVYTDRFADPADFAFVVVGSVDSERVATLAARYLGSLGVPSVAADPAAPDGFREAVRDTGYRLDGGVSGETLRAGSEPAAQVGIVIHSDYQWSRVENHRWATLADLLDIRLREVIREEEGGTYGIGAGGWRVRRPQPRAFMQLGFGTDPARVAELTDRALEVVEELRTAEVSDDYIERVKAQQRERYRRQVEQNGYWRSSIEFALEHGRPLSSIPQYPQLIEDLTAADVLRVARDYLDPANRIEVTLLPAEGAAAR